jgi:dihydroorotate dehydrogenase (NAD+) catalytic subunit
MVYDVSSAMRKLPPEKQIPIIALGGITTWQDAVEFIMAGAGAIQIGTATFLNPGAMIQIIDGLYSFMQRKRYASLSEMCGAAL